MFSENDYLLNGDLDFHINKGISTEEFCNGMHYLGKDSIYRALTLLGMSKHPLLMNRKYSMQKIKEGDFDIFHPTYYDAYFYNQLTSKPFVLTIYDMIHEKFSGIYFKPDHPVIINKKYLATKASKIIAISENTKNDIIKIYNIDEKNIHVVHLANSLKYDSINSNELREKYILFIGERQAYKNFKFFVKSIAPLLFEQRDLKLLCCGSVNFNTEEKQLISELKLEGRVLHKVINNDTSLAFLYHNALAFIFPSLYEGFGIPILEAFSCGCPVVISNTGSFTEIGGDAAQYFDPRSESSILQVISEVLNDDCKRSNMKQRGFKQLEKFSWEKTAQLTKEIYKEVLS